VIFSLLLRVTSGLKHVGMRKAGICIFWWLALGLAFSAYAQKDRKKKPEAVSTAARLQEAEYFFSEGEKFFILGDFAKALLYFQKTHELNPSNATVHFKMAEIYSKSAKTEDYTKAATSIEQAINLDSKNPYFYLLASTIYTQLNEYDKAANSIEIMLREVKNTEEYLYELAAIYRISDRKEDALRVYQRAEEALGIRDVSSFQKIQLRLELKQLAEAEKEAQHFLEAFPDDEQAVLVVADMFSQQGHSLSAIRYAEVFLSKHPDSGNIQLLLAGLYRDSGQEAKARTLVTQLMGDVSVDVSNKLQMLGTYHSFLHQQKQNGKNDIALEAFIQDMAQQLRQAHPSHADVRLLSGDIFVTLNQPKEASEEYRKAIRLGSGSYEAWQNLLFLELQSNQWDSLVAHSEDALELFPNQKNIYYFNGYGQFVKKQFKEAAYMLEQAKRLSSSDPKFLEDVNSLLGDAYNALREYTKSDQAYEEVLTSNPTHNFVANNYSYYLAMRNEKLERAEELAQQLIKRNPTNNTYLDTYAWVLYTRQKYKEARKVMEQVVRADESNPIYYEHMGDILFKLGEEDRALEFWRKAKTLGGDQNLDKKIANRKIN
jgi:tetratricopeptide (TPR) repeat protein